MCSGVWPPSKRPGILPRALLPLVPRPAVLPLEPPPRPTRVLAVFAPGAGRRWCTLRVAPSVAFFVSAMSVNLLDGHEVWHRLDHPADLGTVLLDNHVANALQTEAAQRLTLVLL